MNLKINYLQKIHVGKSTNIAFFLKNDTNTRKLTNILNISSLKNSIDKLKKNNNFIKKNLITSIDIGIDHKALIIWVDKNLKSHQLEKLGAKFFDFLKHNSVKDVTIYGPSLLEFDGNNNFKFEEFIHGIQLKSYNFNIYKSLKKENEQFEINIFQTKTEKNLRFFFIVSIKILI